ncbi:hypothetical protein MMC27_006897 [Xylographa pallens]|nr:hypothetical protein [Xylographa pallens]
MYRPTTAIEKVRTALVKQEKVTTAKMTAMPRSRNFIDRRDQLVKDMRRLQAYLIEMGNASREDLEGIFLDSEVETDTVTFRPSFPAEQIEIWRSRKITDAAAITAAEKVLCQGKETPVSRDLTPEEVVRYCCSIGWSRADLMESPISLKVYKRVWDLYW